MSTRNSCQVRTALIALVILCSSANASAAGLVIDDFEDGPIALIRNSEPDIDFLQTGLDPDHVLGGQRRFIVDGLFDTFGQYAVIEQGTLDTNAGRGEVRVSYDWDPINVSRQQFLRIDILGSWFEWPNLPRINFGAPLLVTGQTNHSPIPGGTMFLVPLSSLPPISGNPNAARVEGMGLTWQAVLGPHISLIAVVPEPTTLALLVAATPLALLRVRCSNPT
jgi:hypothetical protein